MKDKQVSPVALVAIIVAVVGAVVLIFIKAGNSGTSVTTPEDTKQMSDFRSHNAEITGGKIDEKTGETITPSDSRTDEAKARGGGN